VKAYLDFLNIDYTTVEVDPLLKTEIKFAASPKKVPIALINGQTIADSALIIEHITANLLPLQTRISAQKFLSPDSQQWTLWSEKKLAVMLYPNITRSLSESWECFEYSESVSEWSYLHRKLVRGAGSLAMAMANGKIKKKYGIVDERAELDAVVDEWCAALGGNRFLHGECVTLPDLMVYGVLRSIEGLSTFKELMEKKPVLKKWYHEVKLLAPSHDQNK
jgi:microsomal prostaglandin-E synthase 2